MTLVQKTQHTEEMLDNRVEQFRDKSRFASLLSAFGSQIQDIEDALFQILSDTSIDSAAGMQLDGVGTIVGEERNGLSDADYRLRIKARVLANKSSGTIEDLLGICDVLGLTATTVLEPFPANVELESTIAITNGFEVGRFLQSARAAGVGLSLTWFEQTPAFLFDTAGNGFDQGKMGNIA